MPSNLQECEIGSELLFRCSSRALMASKHSSRSKKSSSSISKSLNSPSSSTTSSSSRQILDASVDGKPQYFYTESPALDIERSKENVTVTVRFRPLSSPREIRQGDEVAWYADGDTIIRSEHYPSVAYAYGTNWLPLISVFSDRVFGPTTTTRHVYDVAAQHIVGGAMEGINGMLFNVDRNAVAWNGIAIAQTGFLCTENRIPVA
ncbi:hypothetical protein ACLOJK_006600 [Asimina triloba]